MITDAIKQPQECYLLFKQTISYAKCHEVLNSVPNSLQIIKDNSNLNVEQFGKFVSDSSTILMIIYELVMNQNIMNIDYTNTFISIDPTTQDREDKLIIKLLIYYSLMHQNKFINKLFECDIDRTKELCSQDTSNCQEDFIMEFFKLITRSKADSVILDVFFCELIHTFQYLVAGGSDFGSNSLLVQRTIFWILSIYDVNHGPVRNCLNRILKSLTVLHITDSHKSMIREGIETVIAEMINQNPKHHIANMISDTCKCLALHSEDVRGSPRSTTTIYN
ncbi:hypothetical protein AKO1_013883 [Acrasis kona]|uniref:Uncharacterized protein n=1 Tax=Acrasis kona TaxID=1008807 RepID=A0AAW2YJU3_9EUKA